MRRTALLAGFSAATLLTGMTLATAGGNPTGVKGSGHKDCAAAPGGSGDFDIDWSPTQAFPPNHKQVTGNLTYTAPDGDTLDQLQLTITSIISDEVIDGEELNGSGNTLIDSGWDMGTASGPESVSRGFWIRAERSGRGDGRTYTINYTAKADPAASLGTGASNDCSGSAEVFVPHDMGQGNDNKA